MIKITCVFKRAWNCFFKHIKAYHFAVATRLISIQCEQTCADISGGVRVYTGVGVEGSGRSTEKSGHSGSGVDVITSGV